MPGRSMLLGAVWLSIIACAQAQRYGPNEYPERYRSYQRPAACSNPKELQRPSALNDDDIRRLSLVTRPDIFPRIGPAHVVSLWFFVREDGGTEEVRLQRTSGSPVIDGVALELGHQMRWQPARCGGQPIAVWTYYRVVLGGVL